MSGRLALGAAVALLGAVVMAGWWGHQAALVRLLPWGPPMFFNTALAFLLSGAAVAALAAGWRRAALGAAAAAGALGAASLAEYLAGVRGGIDQVLVRAWLSDGQPFPGRMAFNTAASFVVAAGGMGLLALEGRGRYRTVGAALSGSLVAAVGASALLGYASGHATYDWAHLNRMALSTALGFVLLGGALLALMRVQERGRASRTPWLFAPVGLAVLVMALTLWQALELERRDMADQQLNADLAQVRGDVSVGVQRRIASLVRCARRTENSPVFSETDWLVDARLLHQDFPEYQALLWAGPDLVVRQVVPEPERRRLAGRALGGAAVEAALREHAARMSRPVELPMGERGIEVYVPVYRAGRLAGMVGAVFRIRDLLDSVLDPLWKNAHVVQIYEGGEQIYATRALPRQGLRQQTVVAPAGASWLLRVGSPRDADGGREGELAKLVLGTGVLLAGALSLAVHLAQSARRQRDMAEAARGELSVRVRQQKALSELGQMALAGGSLDALMAALVVAVREALGTPLVKVLELSPAGDVLRLRAGVGWREGRVGEATVPAGLESQAGYTLLSAAPVVVEDLRSETRFHAPELLREHGAISGISVKIPGRAGPFGVLGAHSPEPRWFAPEDAHFLQAAATLLASALERERAESELDQFFELSLDMLCVADLDGRFRRVNPAFERILGYSREELLARPFVELVHPEDREATRREMACLAEGRDMVLFGNRFLCRDGSYRWLLWNSTPAPGRGLVFAAARDITDLKAAEEELRRAHAELEQRVEERTAELERSNRELEAFTYSVSHDLRAPLRHIDGYSRLLLDGAGAALDETGRHYLNQIRQGARRMGLMVDDLLNLSRVARREPVRQRTGLRALVEEVLADLKPDLEGRVVEWRVGDLPMVEADPGLLRQVFVNLLSNALKFTRPRAPAVIEIGTVAGAPAVLYVRDNGVGFNMKYADKLFGVFQRLHRAEDFEGTGIGLATVQRIVQKHGGRVWAEGEIDRGATVYFTLEAGAAAPEPAVA